MEAGRFIINGVNSSTYDIFIQGRPDVTAPARRVTFEYGDGSDGALPYDDVAYDNVELEILCGMSAKWGASVSERRAKAFSLFDGGSYKSFVPYYDDKYEYRVMLKDKIAFRNKYFYNGTLQFVLPLTMKPWKHRVDYPLTQVTKGGSLLNPTDKPALPRIKITGTGDCTMSIGGQTFVVKNINGHIWLDSELMIAYRETAGVYNENSKVYSRDFLVLNTGTNIITWSGAGVTRVDIEPRWRSLV